MEKTAIDLDGFFGLHPSLFPFKKLWEEGSLAIVHAAGSTDPTHSHFDAMDFMEHGSPGDKNLQTGWLARHLETTGRENGSHFRAVSIGTMRASSLDGSIPVIALSKWSEFRLGRQYAVSNLSGLREALSSLFRLGSPVDPAGRLTLEAAETLEQVSLDPESQAGSVEYPQSNFGQSMRLLAQLIDAEVGLEVATVDKDGWDTHIHQGAVDGYMPRLLLDLSESLAAFYDNMGERMNHITVVIMSEFGRRAAENGSGGTDHGHGNVMFVIGRNIHGGKVYGKWPGLAPENLFGPGDLAITTDFRTILAEIVQKRLKNDRLTEIFPAFAPPEYLAFAK
jgi:uncharacterized protein (DUF1501 family)